MTSPAQLFDYSTKHAANSGNSLTLSRISIGKYSNCRIVKVCDLTGMFRVLESGFLVLISLYSLEIRSSTGSWHAAGVWEDSEQGSPPVLQPE